MWPREVCLHSPFLVWGLILTNLLIFASYVSIPLSIYRIHRSVGPEMPEPYLLRVCKAFILFCGVSHLAAAAVIFFILFRIELLTMSFAAFVSVFAAIVLERHRPAITEAVRAYVQWKRHVAAATKDINNMVSTPSAGMASGLLDETRP
jgi:hypothetical protein